MSKRRRSRRDDSPPVASYADRLVTRSRSPVLNRELREWEDRRAFHPDGAFRAFATVRSSPFAATIIQAPPSSVRRVSRRAFVHPQKVAVCVRRHQRKEVLFALGRAGKGARKRPRRTASSEISCRR